jgi:hypothetical protein
MLGLTVMSSTGRSCRSVLMTLEGFVVFDGEHDGRLTVHRALPPFDSPHFADGLVEDIRLVFFAPEGPVIATGTLPDGGAVRRHRLPDGGTVDVEILPGADWRIRRYDASETLTRTVRARHGPGDQHGFPESLELTATGGQDYRLTMTLIEAVPAGVSDRDPALRDFWPCSHADQHAALSQSRAPWLTARYLFFNTL